MPRKKTRTRKKTRRKKTTRKKPARRKTRATRKKPVRKPRLTVASVNLSKDHFSLRDAEAWVRSHRYTLVVRKETAGWYKFPQRPTAQFYPGTFRTEAKSPGVNIVKGKLKDGKTR